MIAEYTRRGYRAILQTAENVTDGRWWIVKTTLLTLFVVLFFSFPSLEAFDPASGKTWDAVQKKADDLTYNVLDDHGPGSNASKINFRLTMPAIAGLFGLDAYGMYSLQVLSGIFVLGLVALLANKVTSDRVIALSVTLMVGSTYAGRTAFVETRGLFDAVSLLFLLAPLYFQHPVVIFSAIFLASWNDERGLVASSLVLLFFLFSERKGKLELKNAAQPRVLAVLLAWAAYFVSRFLYSDYFNIPTATGGVGLAVLKDQINMIPMGLWTAFEGGWFLIFLSLAVLLFRRDTLSSLAFVSPLIVILVVALSVVDISRSTAYALPAIFIALTVLNSSETNQAMRVFCFVALVLTAAWPAYYAGGEHTIWWQYPLPVQVFRWLFLT